MFWEVVSSILNFTPREREVVGIAISSFVMVRAKFCLVIKLKKTRRRWSDLPQCVLDLILKPLTLPDRLRFGSVCRSWRIAQTQHLLPSAPPLPFLILYRNSNREKKKSFVQFLRQQIIQDATADHIRFVFPRLGAFAIPQRDHLLQPLDHQICSHSGGAFRFEPQQFRRLAFLLDPIRSQWHFPRQGLRRWISDMTFRQFG